MSTKVPPKFPDIIDAIIYNESRGNPLAVSPVGAKGLMQLMDPTGQEWHDRLKLPGAYDPFDPEQNRTIGAAYFNSLLAHYQGDHRLALAAYNWGQGHVDHLLQHLGFAGWDGSLPRSFPLETANYIQRVLYSWADSPY